MSASFLMAGVLQWVLGKLELLDVGSDLHSSWSNNSHKSHT